MSTTILRWLAVLCFALLGLAGCATISDYDQVSYQNATSLKVDTLALIDKSSGSYAAHEQDIAAVTLELDKAYEYDNGRPLNTITMDMWNELRARYDAFLADWKRKGSFNQTAIRDYKVGYSGDAGISALFDRIIKLESGKNKPE